MLGSSLNEFRFRAAYGESGKAPTAYSSIRTYIPTAGPSDAAAVTPNTIGNPDLGPERGKEIELGFDANVWQDRAGINFTYYNKKTIDAILDKVVAPSSGQAGTQPINIGGIVNSGFEIQVHTTPVRRQNFELELGGEFATNHNEVTDIGIPNQYFVVAQQFARHQVGYPAFGFFDKRVVSTAMNRSTASMPFATRFPISQILCSDTIPNSHGKEDAAHPRPCYGADGIPGNGDDAPMVYLGRSTPPREGSINAGLTLWNRLHVFSMVDIKNGAKKIDGNTRARCGIFGRCQENFPTMFGATTDSIRTVESNSSSNLVDFFISKSNFARWREFTVSFDIPERFPAKVGFNRANLQVSGRNLAMWTSYQGFEPEAMFLAGTRGGGISWEQTTLPQLRTWLVSLNLGF
jgi:hypothetical protein